MTPAQVYQVEDAKSVCPWIDILIDSLLGAESKVGAADHNHLPPTCPDARVVRAGRRRGIIDLGPVEPGNSQHVQIIVSL